MLNSQDKMDEFVHTLSSSGITAEEMIEALVRSIKLLPPPGEGEVLMIKNNPSLTRLQKYRIIKKIRKFGR